MAESEIARLVEMRQAGETLDQLAVYFGIYRTTVMAHLQRAGVPGIRALKQWSETTLEVETVRYRAGDSLATIASRHGVSPSTVGRWLVRAGVELRPRGWS